MATSAACIFPSPGEFDMTNPSEWTLYKFRLERYLRSPGVKKLSNQAKIDLMLATMGKTADSIYLMFQDKFSASSTVEDVLTEFDLYIRPKVNVVALRAKFGRRKQLQLEPTEAFLRDLWLLAEPCEFPDKEDRIRDQLILGLSNTELSMTLQNDPKMTLDKAVTKARTWEELREEKVNQERAKGIRNSYEQANIDAVNRKGKDEVCPRCGSSPSHAISSCPAKNAECYQCGRLGHWARFCRSKPKEECRSCRCGTKNDEDRHGKSTEATITVAEPCDETFSEDEIYFVT